jgi:hypothetical protein
MMWIRGSGDALSDGDEDHGKHEQTGSIFHQFVAGMGHEPLPCYKLT